MPCMCGADDCPRCHPENCTLIGGRQVYVAEMSDEEVEAAKDAAERAAEERADAIMDGGDWP